MVSRFTFNLGACDTNIKLRKICIMSVIISTFQKFIIKLRNFQNNPESQFKESDTKFLTDIINNLQKAIEGKDSDWQVNYIDILNAQLSCVSFPNSDLTIVVMKQLEPFCVEQIQMRKSLSTQVLDLIYLLKTAKNPSYINFEHVDPKVLEVIELIFDGRINEFNFETITKMLIDSKIFSNVEIRKWIAINLRQAEKLYQRLFCALEQVPIHRFDFRDIQMDYQKRELILRREQFRKTSENLTPQVLHEKPALIFRTSAPHCVKVDDNAPKQISPNDQAQKRYTYPNIASQKVGKNSIPYIYDQPKESGSGKNSGEWGKQIDIVESGISQLNITNDSNGKTKKLKNFKSTS